MKLSDGMHRRDLIKMGFLVGGLGIGPDWLLSENAHAELPSYSSKNGTLKITLVADERKIEFRNSTRWAMTYNGGFPGPILRAKPGDTLEILLINKLSQPTNLHTHGLHASPEGNGDNPLLMIEPGKSFRYSIKISKLQKSGTFWYHPHNHELSAGQVSAGLAGAIIIEDGIDSLSLIRDSHERILVLADPRIGPDSSVIATSPMDLMHGRSGEFTLVNGLLQPTVTVAGSQIERLRIINSCVSQYQTLSAPGAELIQLSVDSSRLPHPLRVKSVTLTPGQRTEILLLAPKKGKYVLQNSVQKIATFNFSQVSRQILSQPLLPFQRITKVDRVRDLRVIGSGMGMMGGSSHEAAFTFDGKKFDPSRIDQRVTFGNTEEWRITNTSSMRHPFHLHAWPFQVTDDGFGQALEGWHDTVNLPSGGQVRIRIPFVDIKGTTVYHCHILDHEDAGMMGIVHVG